MLTIIFVAIACILQLNGELIQVNLPFCTVPYNGKPLLLDEMCTNLNGYINTKKLLAKETTEKSSYATMSIFTKLQHV